MTKALDQIQKAAAPDLICIRCGHAIEQPAPETACAGCGTRFQRKGAIFSEAGAPTRAETATAEDMLQWVSAAEDRGHYLYEGRKRAVLRLLKPRLDFAAGPRVLDLGCGGGFLLRAVQEAGAQVSGLEPSLQGLQVAERRGIRDLYLCGGQRLPFADAQFDGVLCMDVVEHVPDERSVLNEVFRVLRPGGLLLISVPAYNVLWGHEDALGGHFRRYRRPALRRAASKAGFEVEWINYFLAPFFFPVLLVRGIARVFPQPKDIWGIMRLYSVPSRPVNAACLAMIKAEVRLMTRLPLPVGITAIAVCRKPAAAAHQAR
jgi:SAM-dependent methyltransferase